MWCLAGLAIPGVVLGVVGVVVGGALGGTVGGGSQGGMSYWLLFSDPSETQQFHPLTGAVSMVGLFFWSAGAGAALLTWLLLRGGGKHGGQKNGSGISSGTRFFGLATLATTYLLLDDAFLLHDHLLPLGLGVAERHVLYSYAAVGLLFVGVNASFLLRNNPGIVIASALLLGASFLIDDHFIKRFTWKPESDFIAYFVEDGCKLLGIALWCTYLLRCAYQHLAPRFAVVAVPDSEAFSTPSLTRAMRPTTSKPFPKPAT